MGDGGRGERVPNMKGGGGEVRQKMQKLRREDYYLELESNRLQVMIFYCTLSRSYI